MSLESKISKNVFQGNGTTKTFSFTFRVWKEDQVLVYVGIGDETETDVTSSCSITLSENGGTVTFPTAPAVGMTVVIMRNMPFTQEDQYITGARFDPHEIEDRLDQDCAERQQLLDGVERAIKVPNTSSKTPEQYMGAFWEAVKNVLASVWEMGKNIGNSTYVTAKGSDTPRTLADRFGDVVNVKDFGAVGDGVTDDTEALNAALSHAGESGGGVVSLVQGEKYRITSKLLSFDRVQLDGHGATILSEVASGFILEVHGSLGEEIRIAQQPVSSAADNSKTVIKTVSPHNFSMGDRIIIQAARDALAEDSGKYRTGTPTGSTATCQWAEVLTVNKIVSPTEFECTGTLIYPYYLPEREDGVDVSTQPTQRQYTTVRKAKFLRNVAVRDVTFEVYGGNQGYDNTLLFDLCEGAMAEDVTIVKCGENSHGRGIEFCNCFASKAICCTIDASKVYHEDVNVTHTYDNHFTFASCWYCSAEYVTSLHSGQNFDATYSIPTAPTGVRCPCIGIEVVGAVCHGSTDNAGTNHSGAWGCAYRNCRFTQYAYGMLVRSPYTVVDGCSFYGNNSTGEVGIFAIQLSEPTINGCAVTNNIFHGSRGVRIYPFTDRTEAPKSRHLGILISGNSFFDTQNGVYLDDVPDEYAYEGGDSSAEYTDYACDVLGIDIRGNLFSNIKGRVLRLGLFCNGVMFCGNTIKDFEPDTQIFSVNVLHTHLSVVDNVVLGTSQSIMTVLATLPDNDERNAKLDPNYLTHDVFTGNRYQNMEVKASSLVACQTGTTNSFSETIYGAKKGLYIRRVYEIGPSVSTARFRLGVGQERTFDFAQHQFSAMSDNALSLGSGLYRWKQVYAASDSINTSDEREKQSIETCPDAVLDAWGEVEMRQFLFKDAVEKKGDAARIHSGVIAQQVVEAFGKHGLDATRYGLLCYDTWDDEYETVEVVDAPAVLDSEGNEVTPAQTHTEKRLVTAAGDRYGIRYSEALCLEAAYQRRRAQRFEESVSSLETRLAALEKAAGKSNAAL